MSKKQNIKDLDIWKYLKKLTPEQVKAEESNPDTMTSLTDGLGNRYFPKHSGETDLYILDGDDTFFYRYNFKTNEIEAFVESSAIGCNSYDFVESTGVSIGSFADNPEYWVKEFAKNLQDNAYQEAEILAEEAAESIESAPLYNHKYKIKAQVDLNLPEDFDWDNIVDVQEAYKNYIQSLGQTMVFYTLPVEIECDYSYEIGVVYIYCYTDGSMTGEDLFDIWDEYVRKISDPPKTDRGVEYTARTFDIEVTEEDYDTED